MTNIITSEMGQKLEYPCAILDREDTLGRYTRAGRVIKACAETKNIPCYIESMEDGSVIYRFKTESDRNRFVSSVKQYAV